MIISYRPVKLIGPQGIFAGYIILVFGIIALPFTWSAAGLLLIGAAMIFSKREVTIDTEKKSFRPGIHIPGVLKTGRWQDLTDSHTLSVQTNTDLHHVYDNNHQNADVQCLEYCLVLTDEKSKKKYILAYFDTTDQAEEELSKLQKILTDHLFSRITPEE